MDEFGKYLEEHCNYPDFSVEEIELMQEIWEHQQKKIDDAKKLADELWETSSEGRTAELIIQIQEVLK